ncbi:T9SS-dependent choice-of-anchor J family protein [Psychroserpens sp.]|uniref:T9SS-dependent choice-of-anchor J family protein n=1 Tax=Psychroserpens sp. TaxID=2020870 RepID=UPI002B27A457|nr:choice-of-anchor J domain-containing protein [Psychroserpens sp.]
MKKFTFLLFSLLAVCSYGQVSIDEDFDSGTPAGWTDTYANTTSQVCAGQSERDNIFTAAGGSMTSPNQVAASNGTDITFSISYKVVDWSAATVATADGWGNAALQYSTNDGTTWTTAGTIDDSNDSNSNVCTTFSVTIPGASVPTSSDLRFRVFNTWAAGDYYFYIDDFYANQVAATPPNCDSSLTSATTDFAIDGTLTWSAATGGPSGYKIAVGSSMGGTDISGGTLDLGNTTSYTPAGLSYSTTYYTTITPYNLNGDASSCSEESFTVEAAPPLGTDCNSPVDASSLPYVAVAETTSGFGDDYSGSPGASGCGSTSSYLNGDDKVYSFTASADGSINVDLTNITDTYTGVFIYNDCADIGTSCAAGDTNTSSTADLSITAFPVTNGETYYIVVSTWASPQTTTYDLSITAGATCFDVSGLTLDSSTTTSATISWTAAGSETAWEIAVQADGTGTPGTADNSGANTTNNPHTESGLSPSTAYEVYVRAECTAGTDFGGWVGPFDFTTDALCPEVSGLTIDSFTGDSVTVSWTNGASETDWEIAVQADGTGTPGSGTATTNNPHTESGLTGNTAYEVYVRADCTGAGNGFSTWVGPVDFTTDCTAIVPDYTADMSTNVPDSCWDEAGSGEVAAGPGGLGASDWRDTSASYAVGDANAINLFAGNTDREWLLSPAFDLSADGYELVVNVAVSDWQDGFTAATMGSDDEVQLLMSTDGGTTWTNLTTWNVGNQPALAGTEYTEDLTGTTGTDVRFAIWASDGTVNDAEDYDFLVGQFVVRTPPACPDVSSIAVSNISATTADIDWTNGGSETDWEVAIQAQGTGTPGGAGTATTSNPYNAAGLTAQTDYEVYVRSDCGGGQLGAWIGPVNFSTACNTFSLPLVEGFESGVPPTCWTSFRGTNGEGTGFDWTTAGFSNSGSSAAFVRYENVATGAEDWLVTPALDMSTATNPELSFYASEDFGTDYGTVYTIRVSTTNTDHASFTTVQTYTEADFSVDSYDQFSVDLSAYASEATVYVAFVMANDDGDNWYLDDVVIYDNVPTTFTYTSGTWAPFNPMGFASTDDDVVIAAGDAVLSSDLSCDSMTVNPGAGLTVDIGVTLTTASGMTLESSATSYSSLILDGTVAGTMTYERHVNMNGSGSTGSNDLVSAPLTGQAFNTFAAANSNILNNGTLYLFGPFEKVTGQYVNWAGTETSTLDPGVGYRTGTTDNGSVTFTGTANNGTVTNDIINGGSNNEIWNLVGNPYPSYINVQDFLNHDVGGATNLALFDATTAAIYGYDGSALNGWTIYNLATTTPSTVMAPGQGFFVSANAANTAAFDLEFTPAMRSTGSSDDFIVGRNAALTYLILNVSANDKSYNTDLYFNSNASQGFDVGYDAGIWGDTPPEFGIYSHLVQDNVGKPMALQALNSSNLSDVTIALGVNANQGEQITFSISDMTLPASVNVYLEDVVENTLTLLNNSDYVMTPSTALSGTGRFFLRASEDALSTLDNSLDMLNIFAVNASDELVISGQLAEENTMLNLYDIQGRLVLSTKLNDSILQNRIDVSSVNAGVYIVTVQNNSQEQTKKVILD